MTKLENMDLASMSKDTLLELLQEQAAAQAKQTRMAGSTVELVEGKTKAGVDFRLIKVSGGDFGYRGINLRPHTWRLLQAIAGEIDAAMSLHFPGE